MQAAKIILDCLLPPKKDRPINFKLPFIQNAADALEAGKLICHAVGIGKDYEFIPDTNQNMIYLAMIRNMLRRLTNRCRGF